MAFANQTDGSLVETQTSDGLRLHGFLQRANSIATKTTDRVSISPARKECWLVVHGVAGNFYNSSLLASISTQLLSLNHDVLRINTRGRDAVSYFAVGAASSRCGAAFEMISDGLIDIASWVNLLREEGYDAINLLGHSLGAVKSILYVAEQSPGIPISRLVLLSPPRLHSDVLRTDSKYADSYAANLLEAKNLCDSGKPEALLTIRYPQPMIVSAATYWDKYGLESRYDYHRFVGRIKCNTLWCFGEQEIEGPRASFRNAVHTLQTNLDSLGFTNHTLKVIANGDHAYTGARNLLFNVVMEWAQATV